MEMLLQLQKSIFNLTVDNFDESVELVINLFSDDMPFSFNFIISKLIYSAIVSQIKSVNINLYLNFVKTFEIKVKINEKNNHIINVFLQFLLDLYTQESFYILNEMINQNLINSDCVQKSLSLFFGHYISPGEIQKLLSKSLSHEECNKIGLPLIKLNDYKEFSRNNFELHKQYIKEGVNPNEIEKIIRNDEIKKLQEISSQSNFNFNQTIEPSLYERCSFINKENVTLIDYAAFFSAVKCFKYLLMNGAKVENTGKYAVAGGNAEIIHLCEQNHSSFEDASETAIEFHRNDIFQYLCDNKINKLGKIYRLEEFGVKCILFNNFEILSFLIDHGMKINDDIINEAAFNGNYYLIKFWHRKYLFPYKILLYSLNSKNQELAKYLLNLKVINIDATNFCEFCLKFIFLSSYFEIIIGSYLKCLKQHLF